MDAGWPPPTVGDYRLLERVGSGGMAEVYRAVHSRLNRTVAIKFMRALGELPDARARFINEARVHAALQHANIATLYEFHEVQGAPCIVMEFVDGPTLSELLKQRGPLPLEQALRILISITEALVYVHQNGIVHRDLKTSNVKIDGRGQVKLLDFGISRAGSSPRLTGAGLVIGTVEYLAPEQLIGEPASAKSDIWSLGILLYELLTGSVPFHGSSPTAVAEAIRRGSYAAPSRLGIGVTPAVDALIAGCLAVRAEDRFADAEELLDAARAVLRSGDRASTGGDTLAPLRAVWRRGQSIDVGERLRQMPRSWLVAVAISIAAVVLGVITVRRFSEPAGPRVSFRVESQPSGAEVYVDGDYICKTPCKLTHTVNRRIRLSLELDGFQTTERELLVTANARTYTFQLDRR